MREEINETDIEGKTPTEMAAYCFEKEYSIDEVKEVMQRRKIIFPTISEVMNEFMGKKNMSVEDIADLSDINPSTIYRIMNKSRNATRNMIFRIATSLVLNIQETQVLLKSGNCSLLSASRDRDLIIMEGISQERDYESINETLKEKSMPDLNVRG